MAGKALHEVPVILLVGVGDLGSQVLTLLLARPATSRIVLAGRDGERLRLRANLARFSAASLGIHAEVGSARMDLWDVDGTAETLARVRPDIIFMGASLQPWWRITQLPPGAFSELDKARFGPWLPMHLPLVHRLMQAVRASGVPAKVVNAAFPDAVGPVLATAGLAPDLGIGNVANLVPGLTHAIAHQLDVSPPQVELRLVTQHFVSYNATRTGSADPAHYHYSSRIDGRHRADVIDDRAVFAQLNGPLQREGGREGQLLTAASAVQVLTAMATNSDALVHAPSPSGLPGGYPVRIRADAAVVDLDGQLTLAEAVRINEQCQRADGIERITPDGTVTFTEQETDVMRRVLGYECPSMKLDDATYWADELSHKYREFTQRLGI
ncbi:hypothetical protein ABZ419_02295 [Streptomyces cinnamoneus]|uniref:hypothetical protein n=1 Tax=Streptomyces cinnamoneus TaxID=53446 RepID=UPI0033E7B9C0